MTQGLDNSNVVTQDVKGKTSPPYISFLTFNNFILWLETEGVPVKFDRSFWGKKYGGSLGIQLMAGLRFLGLLVDDNTQPQLKEIVSAKGDDRKKLLSDMIKKAYTAVDFSQLSGGTPNMLKEWFTAYNLDGSSDRKARSFFINACKAYGVPLSKILEKTARNKQPGSPREKKVEKEKSVAETTVNKDKPNTPSEPITITKTPTGTQELYKIILSDGCELILCADRVFFEIEKPDRELIENLVEIMKKHRKK
jgi:hypothetical protein